jgi:hypothetical protein
VGEQGWNFRKIKIVKISFGWCDRHLNNMTSDIAPEKERSLFVQFR